MKELIELIARSLVNHPEEVQVIQRTSAGKVHLELKVSKDDMGCVIGKNGKVANAMRVLLRVAAATEGKQATLDVMEPK